MMDPISRRQALQVGGLALLAPFVPQFLAARPAAAATFGSGTSLRAVAAGAIPRPELSTHALWYGTPATSWETQALPIGNARLGAKLFGNPDAEVIQFSEQSFWGGVNDYDNALAGQPDGAYDTSVTGFGSFRDFGEVTVSFGARTAVSSPGGPYTVSGGESVEKTFDGDSGTKWCLIAPPAEVIWQADLAEPAAVASYSLTSANDVPARDPQDWRLEGSTDGTTWTTLDTRSEAPFAQRRLTKTFSFSNTTAYGHFRIVFAPKAGVSHFQVAEVALGGVDLARGSAVYVSSPSGHADALVGSIDADPTTVWEVADAGAGAIWQVELAAKLALTGYVLTSAPDQPDRDPRNWMVSASDDGLTWKALDSRSDEMFPERGSGRTFSFANSTAFLMYRITFAAPASFRLGGVAFTANGFSTAGARAVVDYRRALDIADGTHSVHFASAQGTVLREVATPT
ncbi:discoidin domain-containing protein [Microbacterium sp. SA39]|uniref:discoidin domain-containing protein n=1 Tax=Microbacterium sp. SA39 TaxID=1263625 RepID=UPI0005FA1A8F|nr:discoidin domain-containing protein [Microbacterium sp. SA39]KJQ52856.1 F5/8 type C domain protein [Microbacterium sp. SA39]